MLGWTKEGEMDQGNQGDGGTDGSAGGVGSLVGAEERGHISRVA